MPGLALLESQLSDLDAALGPWADRAGPQVAALGQRAPV